MAKTIGLGLLLVLGLCLPVRADFVNVNDFTDILFWTGSGTNQSALVLYFDDPTYGDGKSPAAVAWGYRWNGNQTAADMLLSLAGQITVSGSPPSPPPPQPGSDPRLAVALTYFANQSATGYFINSLRYNQIGLPSPWQQSERVIDNSVLPPESGFVEIAFYSGLSAAGNGWPNAGSFGLVSTGISDTPLVDGSWYGFVEALYEVQENGGDPVWIGFPTTYVFAQPVAAVPEPSGIALVGCGAAVVGSMAWRRRRRRAA